jgi:GrpB-like predicted nucleotidyltransferase (UPF0157 family)
MPGSPAVCWERQRSVAVPREVEPAEPVVVLVYDPAWPARFQALASDLRDALSVVAERIDHIGSTAVPGLAAKPIIDIQISVSSFALDAAFRDPLERLGYRFRPDNPERTKRYFREPPGMQRTHLHVRQTGSWNEQFALLFRDYLRAHPGAAAQYAALKHDLARQFGRPDERHDYVMAKEPFIWATMREADAWAKAVAWHPGPSDA